MAADDAGVTPPETRLPPRERILIAARELFYRDGIKGVGVEAIAEAAGTNKMTLYRHFVSKDDLVAAYLRSVAAEADARWRKLEEQHEGDAAGLLRAWLREVAIHIADVGARGCALANAAVELRERGHPARHIIEEFKLAHKTRLAALCRSAGLSQPEVLAEELHLLLEGARISAQSISPDGLGARVERMGAALIQSHTPPK